jgi:hypothetical protein
MAMVSLPGSVPEKFIFTVWMTWTAEEINRLMGKRVAVYYEEHIGLPTSCFGETAYFARGVKLVEDTQSPMIIQSVPGTAPRSGCPGTTTKTATVAPHDANREPALGPLPNRTCR